MKTDKTGKFCVIDREKYKEVEENQIKDDREVSRRK